MVIRMTRKTHEEQQAAREMGSIYSWQGEKPVIYTGSTEEDPQQDWIEDSLLRDDFEGTQDLFEILQTIEQNPGAIPRYCWRAS